MHFNLKQIIKAWVISFNPTERESTLAKLRGDVCKGCDSNKINRLGYSHCEECGCPIAKKIFTDEYNQCDLGKWKEIDEPFFEKRKTTKTLL